MKVGPNAAATSSVCIHHPSQLSTDKNVETGEDGYSYPREFCFPCNASDLDQDSFSLVAALEVPTLR